MYEILPLLCMVFILAIASDKYSVFSWEKENYVYRENFLYSVLCILAIVFAGLRTSYNDTNAYIEGYENLSKGLNLGTIDWTLGENPGYWLVCRILKTMGFSSQSFIMIFAVFTIGVQLWFIHKYSTNIALSVFLFFALDCFGFDMAALKQVTAISIALIAVDKEIEGQHVLFFVLIAVAMLFHPFSLMFLVVPVLKFRPWGLQTLIMILGFGVAAVTLQKWLEDLLVTMSSFGMDYDYKQLVGEGVNIFRLAVLWAPIALSLFTTRYPNANRRNSTMYLMHNLATLCAELMIIAYFGNPIYFGRVANYFLIFQTITLPWILQAFEVRSRKLMTAIVIVAYSMYYIYGNVLNGTTFDSSYSSVSILQFLREI